ncbi:MAG: DUF2357 domain-containing protein [Bacilli bacterium]|nr:DUF2357 domain-containing protein [Bacilli bacterium]
MKKLKISNYNDQDYKNFKEKTQIDCNLNINSYSDNYQWVDVFLEYIPYLDAIVRNPRRFIQTDELLVQIEKAKKISEESIKHLAQHTHLIRSVDEEDVPQPSKILNIYKEETYDIYENRFIATLIRNLYIFITMQYDKMKEIEINEDGAEKSVVYKTKTLIDNEEYTSTLRIEVKEKTETIDLRAVKDKIDGLYDVIVQFKKSDLMKQLERAQPVRSPIRKTNAILKDTQLNKCLELWEVLEKLQNDIELDTHNANSYVDENEFVENLTLSNYMNFCTLTNRTITEEDELDDQAKNIFNDLIKIYLERDNIGVKNFRKELVEDLDVLCMQYEKDYDAIENAYENFFNSFTYFSE